MNDNSPKPGGRRRRPAAPRRRAATPPVAGLAPNLHVTSDNALDPSQPAESNPPVPHKSMSVSTLPVSEPAAVLTGEQRLASAQAIVKKYTYITAGIGCVPVPLADVVGIGGAQVLMIKELSHLYGVKFSEHAVRNLIGALVGTLGSRVLTTAAVASVFKIIPGIGGLIGGLLVVPAVAGGVTYGLGRVFTKHFEEGGTLVDLNVQRTRDFFAAQYQIGRKLAAQRPAS